jgi:hypothetical protein
MLGSKMGLVKETSRLSTLGHKWCHTERACSVQRGRWTLKCDVWHVVVYTYVCVCVCIMMQKRNTDQSVILLYGNKCHWTLQFSQAPPYFVRFTGRDVYTCRSYKFVFAKTIPTAYELHSSHLFTYVWLQKINKQNVKLSTHRSEGSSWGVC